MRLDRRGAYQRACVRSGFLPVLSHLVTGKALLDVLDRQQQSFHIELLRAAAELRVASCRKRARCRFICDSAWSHAAIAASDFAIAASRSRASPPPAPATRQYRSKADR